MFARSGVPHILIAEGMVSHSPGCGCDFIRSVRHAPWVSYDMVDGRLSCSRCATALILPTPHVKANKFERNAYPAEVYMDHDAISDELNKFKEKHQNCPEAILVPETKLRYDN